MSTLIGQTVSHYEILKQLGGGGMGIVYKAQDLKLDRPVALKFLAPELTHDAEANERFVHEAKAASALQHNNICVVYDIDEIPDGTLFISMEYLEGESLKEKIARGPLDIDEAIEIAIQISRGLTKAHEHGIIHRDVKSANIMITSEGQAKIVDFGLAKLAGRARLTRSTSAIGTAAYMSPEQAQGTEVDHRTDIWAIGVVLYETLTGRLPFRGEHEPALLYSIVNTAPEPMARWREDIPAALEALIGRALEKDPQGRFQTAAELTTELCRIQRDRVSFTESEVGTASSRMIAKPAGTATSSWKRTLLAVLIPAVLLTMAGAWFLMRRPGPPGLNPEMTLRPLNVHYPGAGPPAISADGNWIVFPASDDKGQWGLYFMNALGMNVRPIPTDATGDMIMDVDISPDGNSLTFSRWEKVMGANGSSIYLVPVTGGTARRVDAGLSPRWRRDGKGLGYIKHPPFAQSASGYREFWTASSDGKNPHLEFVDTVGAQTFSLLPFAWSPDGGKIVWGRPSTQVVQELFTRDLRTGRERQITHGNASIADVWWARENAVVYITDRSGFRNLWMVSPYGGEPTRITQASSNQLRVCCSAGGDRLVYLQMETSWSLHAAEVGTDRSKTLFSGESKIGHFDPSPDGSEIAWETQEQGRNKIIVSKRDGTDRTEIAHTDSAVASILWSPNGKRLAYAVFAAAALTGPNVWEGIPIYVVDPHVTEAPRLLASGYPITWADSTTLVLFRNADTWLAPVDGSEPRKFFKDSTLSLPVLGTTYAFYTEGEEKSRWIARTDGKGSPIRLPQTEEGDVWAFSPDNSFITILTRSHKVLRFHFPGCNVEHLRAALPDTSDSSVSEFRISRNGKEVFYAQPTRLSRMVMIDRPFVDE